MMEQATIIDFLSASLRGLEASGKSILSPAEQAVADDIAKRLDLKLQEMVQELEAIASCQQDMPRVDGLDKLPPFEAFCVGLKTIGDALLPHLIDEFADVCAETKCPTSLFIWIIRARADAFVAYLLQIAQVHGLAFDDKLEKVGKSEQIALANLGADLRLRMQQGLDALT